MPKQLVMDATGDTAHAFDSASAAEVKVAMDRFAELTGAGYTAARRTVGGQSEKITAFDPAIEETLFFPRLQGG